MEFHKYKKIYAIGHEENKDIFSNPNDEIVIEEKMDGGNFRFYINSDGEVIVGSRTKLLDLNADHTKNFWKCAEFVKKKCYDYNSVSNYRGLIFYGECMIKHTMDYDWERMPPYLGFDIYDTNELRFLDFNEVEEIFEYLCLPMVPLIKICKVKDIGEINDSLVPESAFPSKLIEHKQAEGVVFKNYNKQIMGKYVRDKFKEENAKAFGGRPKYNKVDDTDNSEFIFKFCTNERIDKMIFKLLDEGLSLDLKLMSELPKRINLDIWEEHWQDIRDSNWNLNLRNLRRLIPKRCLIVLKQVIVNNAINKGVEEWKE